MSRRRGSIRSGAGPCREVCAASRHYLFIINPTAGGGRARRMWPRLERRLRAAGVRYAAVWTEGAGDAVEIARANAARYDALVAAGGDGTLREVAAGALRTQRPIGLLPLGTGNDFARALGIPRRPGPALAALLQAEPQPIDVGWVNDTPFLNVAGAGFDAAVAHAVRSAARPVRGTLPYLWTVLRLLGSYTNPVIEVRAPRFTHRGPSFLVAVGNAPYYGGGMHICPRASLVDGLLDVCIAHDLSHRAVLGALGALYRGRHLSRADVSYFQTPEVIIEGPSAAWVHADGDLVGGLPAALRIEPAALHCLVPTARGAGRASVTP
ncbi:MAG TPA: diacylglycerol kinase family protein [Limnochordia bacterium]